MKCRRPTRAPHLKGGVTNEARAIPKKVPKRPSDWREATTAAPRRSKGRSAAGTGCSVIKAAAIDPQRPKWKVRGVQVVLQHEDAGEAGAIPVPILPGAILLLRRHEVRDPPLQRGAPGSAGGKQREQRPRRLRRGGLAASGQLGTLVALARLPPTAIGVLAPLQPANRALNVLLAEVFADGAQAAHHRPRPIDIVDAPATEPGAVVALPGFQEVERAGGRLEVSAVAERAEQLEAAAGEV